MKILGVSGSPIQDSNTDRALKRVLKATGSAKTEFIKLSNHTIAPCMACLKCVETNRCIINDDGNTLAEKAYKADALIIAGFTPYSSIDSRTKTFIERLYPLRHRHGLMQGKVGAGIITCAIPPENTDLPPACDNGMQAIQNYMLEEGMNFVGGSILRGNVPCVRCGENGQCSMSGLKMIHGPKATIAEIGIANFEDDPAKLQELDALGQTIAKRVMEG